jgi:putative membrane protein
MTKKLIVAAGILSLAVGCSKKADDLGGKSSPNIAADDNKFLTAVTESNLTEIKTGQAAEQMSKNEKIKDFGKMLAKDHEAAGKKVAAVAAKVGFTPPTELDSSHQSMVDELNKKTGFDFDKAFIKDQIKGHEDTIKVTEDEANNGKNADVKQLATELLPTLREHLVKAKELDDQIKTSEGATTNPM